MDGVYAENRREQFQRISMDGVYAENRREQFQRISMDGVAKNCSSATAPRQLLLRCPTTVHPWTYALP